MLRITITIFLVLSLGYRLPATADDNFSVKDIQGKTHQLSDYRGKWLLINFWATWCEACIDEIPELSALERAHKNSDLAVIGIAMKSGPVGQVAYFAQMKGINYPIIMEDQDVDQLFGDITVYPTTFLINPAGKVIGYQPGPVTQDAVEEYIQHK